MWEILEHLVGLLLFWRIACSLAASIVVAVLFSRFVPFFDATAAITTVILGLTFGIGWHVRSDEGRGSTEGSRWKTPALSRPVAAVGPMLLGLVWGGLLVTLTGSYGRSTLVLLLTAMPLLALNRTRLRPAIPVGSLVLAYALLLAGLGLGALLRQAWTGP